MSAPAPTCSHCGRELDAASPRGLCPRCLLGRALFSEVEEDLAMEDAPTVGDYEILGQLARGGMGVVYRARQRRLNRVVALKLISAGDLATADFVERFRLEAEAAASLAHPNIIPIYEIGEDAGRHFFSMKLAEGGTLGDRLARRQGPSVEDSVRLLVKLARAVHYAHQRGVLHRDIKPNNILLDSAAEPLLSDFGLAKLIERDSQITRTIAVLGTPAYISPEQAAGNTAQITTAADIYGLGAVLYELLAGTPPFAGGTTMATIRQVLEQEPEPPSRRSPRVDRDLDTISLKCLEKQPAQRYASAEALAADLERWLRREPIEARRATAFERGVKWTRRHPAWATAAGVAVVALATVIIVATQSRAHVLRALAEAREQRQQAVLRGEELARRQAETTRQLSRAFFLDGVHHADAGQTAAALANCAQALRLDPSNHAAAARIFHTLTQSRFLQPSFAPIEGHGLADRCQFSPDGSRFAVASRGVKFPACIREAGTGRLLAGLELGKPGMLIEFSPDGRRVATGAGLWGRGPGLLRVWDASTGAPLSPEVTLPEGPTALHFSPDGTALAVAVVSGSLLVFDANSGARRFEFPSREKKGTAMFLDAAWAPDSQRLITCGQAGGLRWLDARTGETLQEWPGNPLHEWQLALSSDGRQLATLHWNDVYVRDTSNGQLALQLKHPQAALAAAFAPDGRAVLTCCEDGRLRLWDAAGGALLRTFDAGTPQTRAVFSADGRRIVSHGRDEAARIWEVATGRMLGEPARHASQVRWAAFNPAGDRVVTSTFDGAVAVWNLDSTAAQELRLAPPGVSGTLAFSHDDARIACAAAGGQVFLWDRWSGKPVAPVPERIHQLINLAFSPDDRWLATRSLTACQVWNVRTGEPAGPPLPQVPEPRCMEFSPDGETLLTAADDGVARLWNWRTGELRVPEMKHLGWLKFAHFSPDGRWFVAGGLAPRLTIWDAHTGTRLKELPMDNSVKFAAWTHSGKRLMAFAGYRLVFFDTSTWKQVGPSLMNPLEFDLVRVTADGRRIVTTSPDNLVRVFDGETGAQLIEPVGQGAPVLALELDRAGRRFATGTANGRAVVFDLETGRSLTGPLWHDDERREDSKVQVQFVEFSGDGRQLLTSGTDGSTRLWDLGPAPGEAAPEWLPLLAEVMGGLQVRASGGAAGAAGFTMEPISYVERAAARERLAAVTETNAWAPLLRWLFAEPAQRERSPLFQEK